MPRSIRDITIALILLGAALLVLFSGKRAGESGTGTRILYTIVRPFQQIGAGFQGHTSAIWQNYINLVGIKQENKALKKEIKRLMAERSSLLNAENENRRLKKLLNLQAQHEFSSLIAVIIGEDSVGWYRTFFLDRGSHDGVTTDMAVTVAEGVVGRIIKCSASMSQVRLISDPNLSVDCRLIRTRDRGILNGSLDGGCILRYLDLRSDVKPGDQVVTSGLDRTFPKGLLIGTVDSIRKGPQGLFLEARVKPAVDFSDIEEVIIILGNPGGFDIQPGLEERR
ncbi:MAG: rod shape-determining protein MreC [Desulfomonilaceae bacterium]